jgi:hypothetical protein
LADNPVKAIAATATTRRNVRMVMIPPLAKTKRPRTPFGFPLYAAGSSSFARNPLPGEPEHSERRDEEASELGMKWSMSPAHESVINGANRNARYAPSSRIGTGMQGKAA